VTDHSATPPQVDFPDVTPSEHDLVEWARKLFEAPAVAQTEVLSAFDEWMHQRTLWLKSYELMVEERGKEERGLG
jgi:hypothetical protein